jgi:hypothetical protein
MAGEPERARQRGCRPSCGGPPLCLARNCLTLRQFGPLERIAPNDAMILPHGAKPDRVKFSERAGLDRPTFQRFDEAKPGLPSHQRCA